MSATTSIGTQPQAATPQTRRGLRVSFWRWLTLGFAIITIVAYIYYGVSAFNFRSAPFPGFLLTYTLTVNAGLPFSNDPWPALEAGMQRQDEIVALNGQVVRPEGTSFAEARQAYNTRITEFAVGEVLQVDFNRLERFGNIDPTICDAPVDGVAACSVSLTLTNFPERDFLAFFLLPYGSALIVILFGCSILYLRRTRMADMLAATIAFGCALFLAGIFDVGALDTLTPLWIMAAVWVGGALASLGLVFPNFVPFVRGSHPINRWVLPYLPLDIALIAGLFVVYRYFNPVDAWDNTGTQFATTTTIIGVLLCLFLMAFVQRRLSTTLRTRDQVNSVLIGLSLMIVPTVLWLVNRLLVAQTNLILPLNFESLLLLYIFPTGFLTYAVLQYRGMDTDEVLTQGITYSIMFGVLLFGVYFLTLGSTFFLLDLLDVSSVFGIAIVLFIMVMAFTPLRTRLQARVNAVYFRARRNYQAVSEEFSQKLATLDNYDEIIGLLRYTLSDMLAPSNLFVFLRNREQAVYVALMRDNAPENEQTDVHFALDAALPRYLEASEESSLHLTANQPLPQDLWTDRNRLAILRARLVTAIRGRNQLNGFVILGPPLSGASGYIFEEIRFVNALVRQFAIATERAQVIETLERSVRELEVIGQIGQAVNFTIGFDEQMELIYTQTNRLIPAPCFYIVLYDNRMEQLYFAFLLEDDDRHPDRENRRWDLGNDLFSEVIRTGRALRIEDYTEVLRQRNAVPTYETPHLKTWMGVPLTAGRGNIFGVMAMGHVLEAAPYTDEEFKVFSDVGSLAATSLDKNMLFRQTQVRERQLTVLNDISQQLVATESDVEQLLQIIMTSAVEILDAEAGSLLLTAEDYTRDLEFRVVIGGAGESLIGTRIEAGRGVAGQVALTGQLRIVNDLEHDPSHAQDIGDSEAFHARTLIAVPLIAKEGVIGVLQVLNKKDGTFFLDEDAELLTTFAGQAAIAIENARLYSERGVQLAERVQELELLESLDRRLNTTFDLKVVAYTTVQVASQYLKAQAGAIGILRESPQALEMVALYGYEPEDYPEGTVVEEDGTVVWPIDRGVIGRVMRMRRPGPDLVTDTEIDPDYERTLRGSLSQMTIPMFAGNRVNAIMVLETNQEPRFGLRDWGFMQTLAEHASIAIANAQFYAELQAANKNKSDFMGFAAHELKNPLTPIKGFTDVLLKGAVGKLSEQQESFVRVIYNNAHRLQLIINDLRDAARQDAGEFNVELSPMNIRHAVIGALQPFIYVLEENDQELVNNVADDMPLVMGDQNRLVQVLTNLVSNASKYSDPGTTITIDADALDDYIDANGVHRGPMVRVSISDQGFGISEEDQKRLFRERYFRSTNDKALDKPGTGLGMTLTFEIMRKHKGDIWVESELGKGSTFYIVVPVATEEAMQPNQQRQAEPGD